MFLVDEKSQNSTFFLMKITQSGVLFFFLGAAFSFQPNERGNICASAEEGAL
jgi:hypothetical protein